LQKKTLRIFFLSGIAVAIGIMVCMTVAALFHRAAMGGKQELKFFSLGSVPSLEGLSKKVQALVEELEKIEFEKLRDKLNDLSVFDVNKVTTCITLLATEVAPPAEEGATFKFTKRIGSSSFDPALKRKPQSLRATRSTSMQDSVAQVAEVAEVAESNSRPEVVEVEDPAKEVTKQDWI